MSNSGRIGIAAVVIILVGALWWLTQSAPEGGQQARAQAGASAPASPGQQPQAPGAPVSGSRISGKQARQLVQEGATLLDVRTPGEFSSGHIEGALNIPVSQLAGRLEQLGAKDAPIVVYCLSGARSRSAVRMMMGQGFTRVYDLGAISAW